MFFCIFLPFSSRFFTLSSNSLIFNYELALISFCCFSYLSVISLSFLILSYNVFLSFYNSVILLFKTFLSFSSFSLSDERPSTFFIMVDFSLVSFSSYSCIFSFVLLSWVKSAVSDSSALFTFSFYLLPFYSFSSKEVILNWRISFWSFKSFASSSF